MRDGDSCSSLARSWCVRTPGLRWSWALPCNPISYTLGNWKNVFPLINKSYWRTPLTLLKGWVEFATSLKDVPFLSNQECSKSLDLFKLTWIWYPFDMIIRLPEVIDHTKETSCSSPLQSMPDFPESSASWLGNPNRLSRCVIKSRKIRHLLADTD